MSHCHGVSLSGTGPSVVAVGDEAESSLTAVRELWVARDGTLIETTTRTTGATIQ